MSTTLPLLTPCFLVTYTLHMTQQIVHQASLCKLTAQDRST